MTKPFRAALAASVALLALAGSRRGRDVIIGHLRRPHADAGRRRGGQVLRSHRLGCRMAQVRVGHGRDRRDGFGRHQVGRTRLLAARNRCQPGRRPPDDHAGAGHRQGREPDRARRRRVSRRSRTSKASGLPCRSARRRISRSWGRSITPASTPNDVTVMSMPPDQITAAWQQGAIDGAFIWQPVQTQILQTGTLAGRRRSDRGMGLSDLRRSGSSTRSSPRRTRTALVALHRKHNDANMAISKTPRPGRPTAPQVKAIAELDRRGCRSQVPQILEGLHLPAALRSGRADNGLAENLAEATKVRPRNF